AANAANTYTNPGSYTVSLTAIGAGGTNILTRPNAVVVTNPTPVIADFTAIPTGGVAPLLVSFSNLSTGAASYSWDFGDGNTGTISNPANTYSNAGTYAVTLTAIGAGGTNTVARTNYIVVTNPPPSIIADFTANSPSAVAPLRVSLTTLSSGATDYTWAFGPGNFSAAANLTNTSTNAGTYTISLAAMVSGSTNILIQTNYILVLNPGLLVVTPASLDFSTIFTNTTGQSSFVISNS